MYCNTPQVQGWFWYLAVPKFKVFFSSPRNKEIMTCKRIWSNCQHLFELKAWGLVPGHLQGQLFATKSYYNNNKQPMIFKFFILLLQISPEHVKFSCKWTESKSVTEVRFAVLAIANGWDGWLSKWSIIKCESLKISFVLIFYFPQLMFSWRQEDWTTRHLPSVMYGWAFMQEELIIFGVPKLQYCFGTFFPSS